VEARSEAAGSIFKELVDNFGLDLESMDDHERRALVEHLSTLPRGKKGHKGVYLSMCHYFT